MLINVSCVNSVILRKKESKSPVNPSVTNPLMVIISSSRPLQYVMVVIMADIVLYFYFCLILHIGVFLY